MDWLDAIIIGLFIFTAKLACRGAVQPRKWGKRKGPKKDDK